MADALAGFLALIKAVGPETAMCLAFAGTIGYFYRRDLLRKIDGLKEAHERRDARDERLITAIEAFNGARERDVAAHADLAAAVRDLAERIEHNRSAELMHRVDDHAAVMRAIRDLR